MYPLLRSVKACNTKQQEGSSGTDKQRIFFQRRTSTSQEYNQTNKKQCTPKYVGLAQGRGRHRKRTNAALLALENENEPTSPSYFGQPYFSYIGQRCVCLLPSPVPPSRCFRKKDAQARSFSDPFVATVISFTVTNHVSSPFLSCPFFSFLLSRRVH